LAGDPVRAARQRGKTQAASFRLSRRAQQANRPWKSPMSIGKCICSALLAGLTAAMVLGIPGPLPPAAHAEHPRHHGR